MTDIVEVTTAMRFRSEAEWTRHIIDYAEANGWLVYHVFNSFKRVTSKGFPDLVCLNSGLMVVAELKMKKRKTGAAVGVSPEQRHWLGEFAKGGLGGFGSLQVYIWTPDDYEEMEETLSHKESNSA